MLNSVLKSLLMSLLCGAIAMSAVAKEATPLAADPALEARVMVIAEELRCLRSEEHTSELQSQ